MLHFQDLQLIFIIFSCSALLMDVSTGNSTYLFDDFNIINFENSYHIWRSSSLGMNASICWVFCGTWFPLVLLKFFFENSFNYVCFPLITPCVVLQMSQPWSHRVNCFVLGTGSSKLFLSIRSWISCFLYLLIVCEDFFFKSKDY